jgi:hypothetical protein
MKQTISLFIICFSLTAYGQNVMASDGQPLGPKKYFMTVCWGKTSSDILNENGIYSVSHFCSCMADEIAPKHPRKRIDHYFTEDFLFQLFQDSSNLGLIKEYITKNREKEYIEPVQAFPHSKIRDSILLELIELCDYKAYFDSIREGRLTELLKENDWSEIQIAEIRNKVIFSIFIADRRLYYLHSQYNNEELQSLLNYFKSLTSKELSDLDVRYDREILIMISGKNGKYMDERIRLALE